MKLSKLFKRNHSNISKLYLCLPILFSFVIFLGSFVVLTNTQAADEALVDVPGSLSSDLGTTIKSPNAIPKSNSEIFSVSIALQPRNTARLEEIAIGVQNPSSPNYNKFLSDNDFLQEYSPTFQDIDLFKNYFQKTGLQITYISTDRLVLTISGTLEQLDSAFNTKSEKRVASNSSEGFINVVPLKLPANLVARLKGIAGFDTLHKPIANHVIKPVAPSPNYADAGYNTPNSLRSTYNITNSGYNGSGAKVGIVFWSAPIQSDLNLWQNYFGHPLNINIVGNSTPNSDADEANLDVQLVHTAAPNATIRFFVAAHASDSDLITATSTAINDNIQVLSNSWGRCEPSISQSTINAFHNLYMTAAARGIAVFASSGDNGVFECQNSGGTPLAGYGSYPATDNFVTAVGGTRLIRENSNDTWLNETGWNCPVIGGSNDYSCIRSYDGASGGGGISSFFARPVYQSSITPPYASKFVYNPSSSMRVVPDISMDADPNSGSLFYYKGQLYYAGGTSASAPLLAGITALAVQRAEGLVGNINSFIYSNYQGANWHFDITDGYNGVYAAYNWDYVTGLGSIKDVGSFLRTFIVLPTNIILQVTPNPAPYGTPVTFVATITTNGRGVPAGNINFYENSTFLSAAPISNKGTAFFTNANLHQVIILFTPSFKETGTLAQAIPLP